MTRGHDELRAGGGTRADLDAVLAELGISPASLAARGLRSFAEPSALELVEIGAEGREHRLTPRAAEAWRALAQAAAADGVVLYVVSAFRSIERQAQIVRRKLDAGRTLDEVLAVSAPPGFSEHHTGCAVDVGTPDAPPLEESFAQTRAYCWLEQRAAGFGFVLSYPRGNAHGYAFEPWHWCHRSVHEGAPPSGRLPAA